MSEHVPEAYIAEWFGEHLKDMDEKIGYMDHILSCDPCRAKLEESLAAAKKTYDATEVPKKGRIFKRPVKLKSNRRLENEMFLVREMLDSNENYYSGMKKIVHQTLEEIFGR